MVPVLRLLAMCLIVMQTAGSAWAQLRGHGGPVRAIATWPDGGWAVSGGFDQSIIVWDVEEGAALSVLRLHEGAVNAVVAFPDGRFATGGEDGRIALWKTGEPHPVLEFADHDGPVAGLAISPNGRTLASASWDGTVRLRPIEGGAVRVLEGHRGNVNAVGFLPDGRIVSVGYDATLRIWPADHPTKIPLTVTLPSPLNALAISADAEIVTAGADGVARIVRPDGSVRAAIPLEAGPVSALAISPDGTRIAAATVGGSVAMVDAALGSVLFSLAGPGRPVWSVAFRRGGREVLTGGADRSIRRWDATTGEPLGPSVGQRPPDLLAGFKGERGAELFQACAACHSLTPEGGNRAGPTLNGVFGRRIATAAGYNYSKALMNLDIVWNADTIGKLFEIGPARYTPGTKMPEQIIADRNDREALVRFLERATRAP